MPAAPERILAVKLADLGDLLITEPALRSLRAAYPAAEIDVLTTPTAGPLVELFDGGYNWFSFNKHAFDRSSALLAPGAAVNLTRFAVELRRTHYDMVVLFHHLTTPQGALKFRGLAAATGAKVVAGLDNGRGEFLTHRAIDFGFGERHEVEYMLAVAREAGGSPVDPAPRIAVAPDVPELDLPPVYAALFPTTGPYAPGRNWPVESWAALACELAATGLTPVILGAADATEHARHISEREPSSIDLTGQTTIAQLATVVREAQVTVTGDSFPGHLASAVGGRVVSIFGPSNHRAWGPYGAVQAGEKDSGGAIIVRKDVPCAPCLYTGYRLGRRFGCPVRTCLENIEPEDVMSAVRVVTGLRS